MVENTAVAVAAEIERMAEQSALDASTVAAGIKIFIADRVLAEEGEGQVSADAIIEELSLSLRDLTQTRRSMPGRQGQGDLRV